MAKSSIRFVGAISRALGLEGAPTTEEEDQVISLLGLYDRMRLKSSERTPWLPAFGQRGEIILHHETATGRLRIEAIEDRVHLEFVAGLDARGRINRHVVLLIRIDNGEDDKAIIRVLRFSSRTRKEHVELLFKIDKEVCGEIEQALVGNIDYANWADSDLRTKILEVAGRLTTSRSHRVAIPAVFSRSFRDGP